MISTTQADLRGAAFSTRQNGCAVGLGGTILRTSDGGESWNGISSGTSHDLYDIVFSDSLRGIAVGSGTILRTTNGGSSWQSQSVSFAGDLYSVDVNTDGRGWSVGQQGKIFRNSNSFTGLRQMNDRIQAQDFSLEQNYPNPFNPSTVIQFLIPEGSSPSNVILKVYSSMGQEVATLVDGVKESGRYSVEFNGKGLSSGLYFYSFTAGSFTDVKKLLLVR